jgi:hypothetical protein
MESPAGQRVLGQVVFRPVPAGQTVAYFRVLKTGGNNNGLTLQGQQKLPLTVANARLVVDAFRPRKPVVLITPQQLVHYIEQAGFSTDVQANGATAVDVDVFSNLNLRVAQGGLAQKTRIATVLVSRMTTTRVPELLDPTIPGLLSRRATIAEVPMSETSVRNLIFSLKKHEERFRTGGDTVAVHAQLVGCSMPNCARAATLVCATHKHPQTGQPLPYCCADCMHGHQSAHIV